MNRYALKQPKELLFITDFLSHMAHYMNNRIEVISGWAQLLLNLKEQNEKVNKYAGAIMDQSQQMARTVEAIRRFTHLDSPHPELTPPEMILQEAISFARREGWLDKIKLIQGLASKQSEVCAFRKQLQAVFVELICNAVAAMPQGGTLTISTSASRDTVRIAFADTGVGIADADRKKVFDPFFGTKTGAFGLGLFMVSLILDAHNGSIRVKSTPGSGTEMAVILPKSRRMRKGRC